MPNFDGHFCRCGDIVYDSAVPPPDSEVPQIRERVEPWVSALAQSEHLALLVGSGLTMAVANAAKVKPRTMGRATFGCEHEDKVNAYAEASAKACGRGEANLEDQLRAAQILIEALQMLAAKSAKPWREAYDRVLSELLTGIVEMERGISKVLNGASTEDVGGLMSFLLSLANRPPTRNRLEIFTTNYDRLLEYACDLLGVRVIDRFVGSILPQFKSSRLTIDMHYDPPGMRGEPRYLEGVVRLCKLHGSIDWRMVKGSVVRAAIPFGPEQGHPLDSGDAFGRVMVYPNAAKDVETLLFPYADLFRDLASALCRPNVTLVTYGYGFGDDHVNRVIREMLSIGSTHLLIASYDGCGGRLKTFCERAKRDDQISLLVGSHFGDLPTLGRTYLPRALLEPVRQKVGALKDTRTSAATGRPSASGGASASKAKGPS